MPSQHLPGDPEISSEDTKFALFIVENSQNNENSEQSVSIEESSENLRDTVHPKVINSELDIGGEIQNSVDNSNEIPSTCENPSYTQVLRTYLACIF